MKPAEIPPQDIGLAVSLALFLVAFFGGEMSAKRWLAAGIVALILTMVAPGVWRPLLPVWKFLLRVLETVVSKALLFIVFFLVITPVAFVRKAFGKDALQAARWKKKDGSVFLDRKHLFDAGDLANPY